MGIDLRWEDENGKQIAEVTDPQMCISRFLLNTNLVGTTCLRFIDPYGDTTFNQLQIPILIDELRAAVKNLEDSAVRDHLCRVIELAGKSRESIHTCLKFYGD